MLTEEELDRAVLESAEREAEAQLKIVKVLSKLTPDGRRRVCSAVSHLLEAEKLVDGILDMLIAGSR